MIVLQVLLVLSLVEAASRKPAVKRSGITTTPKRSAAVRSKLSAPKAKPVLLKKSPAKNNIATRKPAVNRKVTTKITAVRKPVVNSKATVKNIVGNKKPAVSRKAAVDRKPAVKRNTPAKKKQAPKKAAPTKKPVVAKINAAPRKQAVTKKNTGKKSAAQSLGVARTKSWLEAADAYMKAQTPLQKSGDRMIKDLIAGPAEIAEPYDPQRFFQARSEKVKERIQNEGNAKAQSNVAPGRAIPSWILVVGIVAILVC